MTEDVLHQTRFKTECCAHFVDVESSEELDSVTLDACPDCGFPSASAYEV